MSSKNSAKGAKKGRRFGRPRSPQEIMACAKRKAARIAAQNEAHARNIANGTSPWQVAKEARRAARHDG
jgi:hypothetical protein